MLVKKIKNATKTQRHKELYCNLSLLRDLVPLWQKLFKRPMEIL